MRGWSQASERKSGQSGLDPKADVASFAVEASLPGSFAGARTMDDRLKKVVQVKPKPEKPE